MKHGIYFYNPLTWLRPCEQAKPLREHMKRLRVFSRALFASCESASRNSPAMRRRASALPAAFRAHPCESAMKHGIHFYNPLTRHRPTKTPQSPRDRSLSSRTSLPSPRVGDETPNLSLQFANASSPGENPPVTARLPVFSHALRPPLRVSDETPNLSLQFANAASPGENPPVTARLPVFSHTLRPPLRASDEAPNLFLQSANASSHPPAPLRARPIIETTRRHRLRGLSRAIAKRRPWRKIAGNRPARGFQNFSIECSIFVHKKAKMGGYTVSIETKGGNGL